VEARAAAAILSGLDVVVPEQDLEFLMATGAWSPLVSGGA
jgi:hypothetical protein